MGTYMDTSVRARADVTDFASDPLDDQVEHLLRPLQGMRLRVSLFAMEVIPDDLPPAHGTLPRALATIGVTGIYRNGRRGLLYIGPRPPGPDGDGALERWIADTVECAFRERADPAAADIGLVAVHRWLNEIAFPDDLIEELALRLHHPLPLVMRQHA